MSKYIYIKYTKLTYLHKDCIFDWHLEAIKNEWEIVVCITFVKKEKTLKFLKL